MRRKEKAITERAELEAILAEATVCRLAMCDADRPYIVPMNFGYRGGALYFHCATEGKKLGILARNDRVCFEMDVDHEVKRGDNACDFGMKYRSVIGFGSASIIDDPSQKAEALDIVVEHYSASPGEYPEALLKAVKVIKVEIESMTGKKSE
jgi:nitroimidazol reductase NimA-like FMN-containing flavoprotein (pyridoxamine 5'-phosphate oxidase superfamily)